MDWNERHELFCREYIVDKNGTQAYIRAGYDVNIATAAVKASQLLKRPEIRVRIEELGAQRKKDTDLDAHAIILEALRILVSDPLSCVDEEGRVKKMQDIPIHARRAIASFEVDTVGGEVKRTRIKFWSKEKAIELLGKHLSMFKEHIAVEGLDDIAARITEARKREEPET